jgi:hypothetical protein
MQTPPAASFPPPGWLTREQAAGHLGLGPGVLACDKWKWRSWLAEHARRVPRPGGWHCTLYPLEQVERVRAAREAAYHPHIPDGFVDAKGAIRRLRVSTATWHDWMKHGTLPAGHPLTPPEGKTRMIYAIEDLDRLRQERRGEDKPHLKADKTIHVPPGFIRRQTACGMFGVGQSVWQRWENEGTITCGVYHRPWPKLYPLTEIKRLLLEFGRLSPPYPDALHPGCYRVPLAGTNIRRREVLIDADALPLIEPGVCNWGGTGTSGYVKYTSPDGPHCVPLRRLILGVAEVTAGREGGAEISIGHANDDPLDCRRENLVVRTPTERQRHMRKCKTQCGRPTSSRFKGVSWIAKAKRWQATIKHKGKSRNLGHFTDELAAAAAYDEAARQWYGEHARLNFPDGVDAWIEQDKATWRNDPPAAQQARAA